MNAHDKRPPKPSSVTTGCIGGSRKVYLTPQDLPMCGFLSARSRSTPRRESRRCVSMIPPVLMVCGDFTPDLSAGLPSPRPWPVLARRARNLSWPRGQARGQWLRQRRPSRAALSGHAQVCAPAAWPTRHAIRVRTRRDHHRGDDLRRASREYCARGGG